MKEKDDHPIWSWKRREREREKKSDQQGSKSV